jgi:hypothetical protein
VKKPRIPRHLPNPRIALAYDATPTELHDRGG